MKKVELSFSVVGYHFSYMKAGEVAWSISSSAGVVLDAETIACIPQTMEFEVPEDLNVTALQVAGLQRERERVCKEFADSVREIDTRISKLQALEFEGVKA